MPMSPAPRKRITPSATSRLPDPDEESNGASPSPDLMAAARQLLRHTGEDPKREGLLRTPERFARSWAFLTGGYDVNIDTLVNDAIFTETYDEIVVVRNIHFFSLCEHHLLPFYGQCHVAYIPQGRLIGLSKIPRIVDAFSRRLQIQERLTRQIARCLNDRLAPMGVAVIMEASHLCMSMRGVEKPSSRTVTSELTGIFKRSAKSRAEVLALFGMRPND